MKLVTKLFIGGAIVIGSVGIIVGTTIPSLLGHQDVSFSNKIKKQEFKILSSTSLSNSNWYSSYPREANIYDAKYNTSAKNIFNNIVQKVNDDSLNKDLNSNIKAFLNAYAHQIDSKQPFITNINIDKKISENKYLLNVSYLNRERSVEEQKQIEFNLSLELIDDSDISLIKNNLLLVSSSKDVPPYILNLKKKFLGNSDKNESNDNGLFDRVKKISNDYLGFNRVLSYKINILEFFKIKSFDIQANKNILINNSQFYAPSLSIDNGLSSFVPNKAPKLGLKQNNNIEKGIMDRVFANSVEIINKKDIGEIVSILFINKNARLMDNAGKIQKIWISKEVVNNKDANKVLVEFSNGWTPELYIW